MSSLLKRFAAGVSAVALTGSGLAYAQSDGDADGESQDIDTIDVIGTLADHNSVSALPVQVLSGDALANRRQGGLGETLAGLPGVHLDSFGAGASRPVIRGQTVPRIEVLSDGANMFDVSSVSPDHAIASEPLLLDGIEVLRGPAAALYGGNALNGAVNLIDGKVPTALPESGLSGGWEARYGTGDNERAFAGRATAGGGPFAIHVEGFTRTSDNYAVPEAFGSDELTDSYAEGAGYAIGASWITSKGHIGAAYSRQDGEYGLPGHSHSNAVCHTHGADLHCEAHDEFSDPYQSSDGHTAYINLRSDRVDVRADYDDLLPGISHARMRLSYTDYQHNEIDGPILFSEYTNEVYDGRVELTHAPFFGFTGTFGTQYTDGTFAGLDSNLIVDNTQITELYIALTRYAPPVETKTENRAIFLSESRAFGRSMWNSPSARTGGRSPGRSRRSKSSCGRVSRSCFPFSSRFTARIGSGSSGSRPQRAMPGTIPTWKRTPCPRRSGRPGISTGGAPSPSRLRIRSGLPACVSSMPTATIWRPIPMRSV